MVSESGTFGEQVTVSGTNDEPYIPREVPAYIAGFLRSLGYHVELHLLRSAVITQQMRRHYQLTARAARSAVLRRSSG
jgi:hypothetical protein